MQPNDQLELLDAGIAKASIFRLSFGHIFRAV